jgi:hypothetical protein
VHRYRSGFKSRWWWGEVDHLLIRLRHSRQAPTLRGITPSRLRAVFEFLEGWWQGREEILRADDPMPFVRETLDWARRH